MLDRVFPFVSFAEETSASPRVSKRSRVMNTFAASLSLHRSNVFAHSLDGLRGLRTRLANELGVSTLISDHPRRPFDRFDFLLYDAVLLDPVYGTRPTTPAIVFGDTCSASTRDARTELLYRLAVLELLDLMGIPDAGVEETKAALDWLDDRHPHRSRHIVDREVAMRDFLAWRDADRNFEKWFVERFVLFRLVMG